ncbi:MAG: alcohol dehydrogenase catalytic domain-containing protein [Spirochaetaceae bacterium]|nr:MAG: alcohol dehydrogenase catalytic domain-containing protein [Spirochaetaceae bacterium]
MKTMKVAVLEKPKRMVIEERPIPEPGPGWVRLKNKASGICGSDMHIYTGNHPWLQPGHPMEKFVLGNVYGHEIAGLVDALGGGVEGIGIGDRAAVNAIVPCHRCEFCRVGLFQLCRNLEHYGFHYPGGFAEYTLVPATNILKLPQQLSFEEAAILDVLVVGVHAVQLAEISMADRVAILGAGPIGLAMAAAVKRSGAREIFITAKHPIQKELARSIGVDHVLETSSDAVLKTVAKYTGDLGVDCVLESVGYKSNTMELALQLVRRGGRIIFTGVFEEDISLNMGTVLIKEATIRASHAFGMWNLVHELELAVEMMVKGQFPAKQMITHSFPLEKINEAFAQKLEENKKTVKVEIVF